jgi:ATP adenylyltransferase
MDHLWTPWRYAYITDTDPNMRKGVPRELSAWTGDLDCIFCNMIAAVDYAIDHGTSVDDAERAAGVVVRGEQAFICLNRYPYTAGHIMVVPYEHQSSLAALAPEIAHDLMDLTQRTERALGRVYSPDGFNMGLNLGKAVGRGYELYDRDCGDAGSAGGFAGDLAAASRGVCGGGPDGLVAGHDSIEILCTKLHPKM